MGPGTVRAGSGAVAALCAILRGGKKRGEFTDRLNWLSPSSLTLTLHRLLASNQLKSQDSQEPVHEWHFPTVGARRYTKVL